MPVKWQFRDYRTVEGEFPFRDWIRGQPDETQSEFITTRKHLSVTENWSVEEGAKPLDRKHEGLIELFVDFAPKGTVGKKRRFRPVGVQLVESREFVLFGGAEKTGRIYAPPDAFDRALKLWRDFQNGLGELHDHEF